MTIEMKKPTTPEMTEWLAETSLGNDTVLARYDHTTDNYEILVNDNVVWGSNGLNRHDIAETVFEAVVDTVRLNRFKASN